MSLKTYSGSCHCAAVRFEADVDLSQGTVKCNCSSCTKARSWLVFASPDRFRLIAGADSQAVYQWTPPGRAAPNFHYHFCRNCARRPNRKNPATAPRCKLFRRASPPLQAQHRVKFFETFQLICGGCRWSSCRRGSSLAGLTTTRCFFENLYQINADAHAKIVAVERLNSESEGIEIVLHAGCGRQNRIRVIRLS